MNILASFGRAQRRRQAVRQIRALPPELLNDIGIEPDRIDDAVSEMLAGQVVNEAKKPAPRPDALFVKAPVFLTGGWPYPTRRAE